MSTSDSTFENTTTDRKLRPADLGKLAYAAVVVAGVVLAATGVGTYAFGKTPLTHWILMLHVSAAPLFALGLALLSLTGAARTRAGNGSKQPSRFAQTLFWLILLGGLVLILSGIAPMTPLFGTDGQHLLYLIHRYSGIALTIVVALHWVSPARRLV